MKKTNQLTVLPALTQHFSVAGEHHPIERRILEHLIDRLLDEHRHDDAHLDADQQPGDHHLGGGRHEAGLLGDDALLAAGENARNAIRLGDQGGVHDGEAEAGQDAGDVAGDLRGLRYQRKGGTVAEEHAKEDHVGELAGARLDDGRVVVADENDHREEGHGEAEQGGADGDQRGGVRPADELYGNGFAA